MTVWPLLAVGAAGLQVVRNATQRSLTGRLGVWGATYIRFLYGLPFALLWTLGMFAIRGYSGGPSLSFVGWTLLGAATQVAATGALVLSMRTRALAVTTALLKTEILAAAVIGMLLIDDRLSVADWTGAAIGTAGVLLMTHVSINRAALQAALAGAGAGIIFAISSVAYRAAAHAWGADPWTGAAATLSATLAMQTVGGGILLALFSSSTLTAVTQAWKPSLVPGAAGAISSAMLFTAFALGPSAAAVKTIQLVDVLIAWMVSRHMFREHVSNMEVVGALLVLSGAVAVLL